jgi:putative endonuclease
MTNKPNGVLYIGSSKQLKKRVYQHKNKSHPKTFSARYNLNKLVFYESHDTKETMLLREKQLKKWNRDWKIELINKSNPEWKDLSDNIEN